MQENVVYFNKKIELEEPPNDFWDKKNTQLSTVAHSRKNRELNNRLCIRNQTTHKSINQINIEKTGKHFSRVFTTLHSKKKFEAFQEGII